MIRLVALAVISVVAQFSLAADGIAPADRTALAERAAALREQVNALRKGDTDPIALADVAVCAKAAEWIVRHDEFFKPGYLEKTRTVLEIGERRAAALKDGNGDWATRPGGVGLGYVSKIDGSVQPYSLTFPEGYDASAAKRWPLYVVLHGRNGNLTEASFLADAQGGKAPDVDYIRLDVYGRGNNAFRWSGEADVFEAIDNVRRRARIDGRRIVLWGFSMGGAGAWHLGLHHPDAWAAVGAGAGFVDYYGYVNRSEPLPQWQDTTLSIYDSVDYALNAANVPFVTYGGELDKQLLASETMLAAADPLGVEIEFILGQDAGHKFTPEGEQAFQAFLAKHAQAGRPSPTDRKQIRFTTSTLKYNECGWVRILELEQGYEPATVETHISDDGQTAIIATANVAAIAIGRDAAMDIELDGNRFPLRDAADGLLPDVLFEKTADGWQALDYGQSREFASNPERHKRHNLQGPIDDAFTQPFIVVRGTETPWSPSHQAYADWSLARFQREYNKYLRAKVPVITPDDVTEETIATKNLVLFGDPGSNPLIAKILPDLPLKWTQDAVSIAGQEYDSNSHAVVLIYPNPLNPERYVVLNSGHTFHEDAFQGTNALLFPRLGDAAVLKFNQDDKNYKETTTWAAIFDSQWKLKKAAQ